MIAAPGWQEMDVYLTISLYDADELDVKKRGMKGSVLLSACTFGLQRHRICILLPTSSPVAPGEMNLTAFAPARMNWKPNLTMIWMVNGR